MARTNTGLMAGIIRIPAGKSTAAAVNSAHQLVEAHCLGAANTEEQLTTIETWAACHFFKVANPDTQSVTAGVVSEQKVNQVKPGFGLAATIYGQQAMAQDFSGGLAAWNNNVEEGSGGEVVSGTARTKWLGTPRPRRFPRSY